ncbi:MAG: MBL fold metallo-hydrolase [Candidatus Dormibacteraeota bacterium]|nr:MBL fold metallo-hydrolase [Candidatus Dormibacteraeota bacterium]
MARLSIVKVRGEHEVNTYVLSSGPGGEAVVIDPSAPPEKVLSQVQGLTVRWVVATHGHPGHLAGKDAVKAATGAQTAMHMADAKAFLRSADRYLLDGDELEFGTFRLKTLTMPGHTPGSLAFQIGNHLFTGDTLLAGGIGKQGPDTDLRRQLISIGSRISSLTPETAIYPGHGPVTNLAAEIRQNPIFRGQPV